MTVRELKREQYRQLVEERVAMIAAASVDDERAFSLIAVRAPVDRWLTARIYNQMLLEFQRWGWVEVDEDLRWCVTETGLKKCGERLMQFEDCLLEIERVLVPVLA